MGVIKPYKNWVFFDKAGDSYNFEYDEVNEKFTGSIFFPKISTGLVESQHIYIAEKFIETGTEDQNFPTQVTGLPEGFSRTVFSVDIQEPRVPGTFLTYNNCTGNVFTWNPDSYPSLEDFYEQIITDIQSLPGHSTSYRIENNFFVIVDASVAPCY